METKEKKEKSGWEKTNRSVSFRFVLVGILSLVLLIPAEMIKGLIRERQERQNAAEMEISEKWGNPQFIGGPVISVPYFEYYEANEELKQRTAYLQILPEKLHYDVRLKAVKRYRGIFEAVVYTAIIEVQADLPGWRMLQTGIDIENIQWDDAVMNFGIADLRGLDPDMKLIWKGKMQEAQPGTLYCSLFQQGFHFALDESMEQETKNYLNLRLILDGSSSIYFYPLGKETQLIMLSDWPDPGFDGYFLPDTHDITNQGFTAQWQVFHLNRNYPQIFRSGDYTIAGSYFGTKLVNPVDHYHKAMRAIKYAILFIALTFLVFLFTELLHKQRLHPIQYLLVGMALVTYYILLVSLTEHLAFAWAFWIGATAVTAQTFTYVQISLKRIQISVITGGILLLLYAFLFVIMEMQEYSLLMGSIGLFLILSIIMIISKKIDWFSG